MKKYKKEIIVLIIQLIAFYTLPLLIDSFNAFGLVFMLLLITLVLSISLGITSDNKIKWFYPLIIALLFIPSVFIYYNDSALIHSIWYLIDSIIGLLLGTMFL